jgi:2-keto-4-pentenoate hydratase/2-oxohepta-3-ene-1,7-dioic acid hydratase in catechol pathway
LATGFGAGGLRRRTGFGHGPQSQKHHDRKAMESVLGFTLANDITARDLQKKDGQWTRAKGFDGFCPLGPAILTQLDWENFEFQTSVNEIPVQVGKISDLIFSLSEIVAFVSEVMTLFPGDVILTGTPPGIGPLKSGDRVAVAAAQIGKLENRVIRP